MTRAVTVVSVRIAPAPARRAPTALATCCALAIACRPSLIVRDRTHADALVSRVLAAHTEDQVLRWRQNYFDSDQDMRWRWARQVLREHFSELPGALDIPHVHQWANLPAIPSAGVTPPSPRPRAFDRE